VGDGPKPLTEGLPPIQCLGIYAYSDEFDFGLDLILDGLEGLRPTR
jgi:hypothetical protein